MNYPSISIIFPVYNGIKDTIKCLKSINLLTYPASKLQIIVVDNGSTDDTQNIIKSGYPKIKLIKLKKNSGFAKAINIGSKLAKGEFIFISNNDIVFTANYFNILIKFYLKYHNIGALGGLVYSTVNKNTLISTGFNFNYWLGQITDTTKNKYPYQSDWIQGCQLLTPRNIFIGLGGLDESFNFYFEDADYCQRLRLNDYSVWIIPQAKIYHSLGITINKETKYSRYLIWYTNKLKFIRKYASICQIICSLLVQITYLLLNLKLLRLWCLIRSLKINY